MNQVNTSRPLHAAALVAFMPFALVTPGCGGGSHSGSSAPLTNAPINHTPGADSPSPSPTPSQSFATVLGTVTRVDNSATSLAGQTLVAVDPNGAKLAQATTDAQGNFTLEHINPEVEIEVEIEPNAPAEHRIHVGALQAGEHATVRCHVLSGHIAEFALSCGSPRVHSHLSTSSGIEVEIEVHRSSGATSATIDARGASASTDLHLVDATTASELAHMIAGADGTAHLELQQELAGDVELHDAAGALLATGHISNMPRDEAELESRENGSASFAMTSPAIGSMKVEADDDGDKIEIEVDHLGPGQSVDVRLELSPGALSSVGTITTDDKGRGRLRLTGSTLPARTATLIGRRMELASSATIGTGSMPELIADF